VAAGAGSGDSPPPEAPTFAGGTSGDGASGAGAAARAVVGPPSIATAASAGSNRLSELVRPGSRILRPSWKIPGPVSVRLEPRFFNDF
jgi:hypothetical protein